MKFDVDNESDMFFEAHKTMRGDSSKFHIYEIPHVFYLNLVVGPSRQHSTLYIFFECCISPEKDPYVLDEIVSLLYRPEKGRKESTVNSLHKKKNGKEIRMNVHIGDYDVDSIILDLG